jgi:hypothetical protein
MEPGGRSWFRDTADSLWWASLHEHVGSVLLMVAALADFTLTTGEPINIAIVNSGTFVGAASFLTGAHLMLPPTPTALRRA